jgi:hypothetical protein
MESGLLQRTLFEPISSFSVPGARAKYNEFITKFPAKRSFGNGNNSLYAALGTALLEHYVRPTTTPVEFVEFVTNISGLVTQSDKLRLPDLLNKLKEFARLIERDEHKLALQDIEKHVRMPSFIQALAALMRLIAVDAIPKNHPGWMNSDGTGESLQALAQDHSRPANVQMVQVLAEALRADIAVFTFKDSSQEYVQEFSFTPTQAGTYCQLGLMKDANWNVIYSKDMIEVEGCIIGGSETEYHPSQLRSSEAEVCRRRMYVTIEPAKDTRVPLAKDTRVLIAEVQHVVASSEERYDDPEPVSDEKLGVTVQLQDDIAEIVLGFFEATSNDCPAAEALTQMRSRLYKAIQSEIDGGQAKLSQAFRQLLEAVKEDPPSPLASSATISAASEPECRNCRKSLSLLKRSFPDFCDHLCLDCIICLFKVKRSHCTVCNLNLDLIKAKVSALKMLCKNCREPKLRLADFNSAPEECDRCSHQSLVRQ